MTEYELVRRCNFEELKQMHEDGIEWHDRTCDYAAAGGHLHILQYAYEHGIPWRSAITGYAAGAGQLECLRYARKHGCKYYYYSVNFALMNGRFECLRYMFEEDPIEEQNIDNFYWHLGAALSHDDRLKSKHIFHCAVYVVTHLKQYNDEFYHKFLPWPKCQQFVDFNDTFQVQLLREMYEKVEACRNSELGTLIQEYIECQKQYATMICQEKLTADVILFVLHSFF